MGGDGPVTDMSDADIQAAAEDLLRELDSQIVRVALGWCSRCHLGADWADDIAQEIRLVVYAGIHHLLSLAEPVRSPLAALCVSIKRGVNRYLDSVGGLDGRTGLHGIHRRLVRLRKLHARWVEGRGCEPVDPVAFLAWANAEQAKTHADPARSGMVFGMADWQDIDRPVVRGSCLSVEMMVETGREPVQPGYDGPVQRYEMIAAARQAVATAKARDPLTGQVAAAWLDGWVRGDDSPQLPTVHDLTVQLRRSHAAIGCQVDIVAGILRDELSVPHSRART